MIDNASVSFEKFSQICKEVAELSEEFRQSSMLLKLFYDFDNSKEKRKQKYIRRYERRQNAKKANKPAARSKR